MVSCGRCVLSENSVVSGLGTVTVGLGTDDAREGCRDSSNED